MQTDWRRSLLILGTVLVAAALLLTRLWHPASMRLRSPEKPESMFRAPSGAPIVLDEPPSMLR